MANFDASDTNWTSVMSLPEGMNEFEQAIIFTTYDQQTELDITRILEKMKKEAKLKKICLYKMLIYPFDYFFLRLIFGKERIADKKRVGKLYRDFYFKRITMEKFEKELNYVLKQGKLT